MDPVSTATAAASSTSLDPLSLLHMAAQAYHSHAYALLAGALLTLAVIVLRQFNVVAQLPSKYVPWATVGLSILSSVGLGLEEGKGLADVALTGLAIGWMAIGAWETAGKMGKSLMPPSNALPPSSPSD